MNDDFYFFRRNIKFLDFMNYIQDGAKTRNEEKTKPKEEFLTVEEMTI